MRILSALMAGCILFMSNSLAAQDKLAVKFGKITPSDFDLSKYSYDTSASAVVIADIGFTSFEGDPHGKGDFVLVFTRFKRIKIINRKGFDVANEEFNLYHQNADEEKLDDVKGITFNLEGGKVVETKLESKSIFTDKLNKEYYRKKFTMPAIKEGSIIDITYTIKSDFYTRLKSWDFQGEYPILWSEYEVHIPQFFNYQLIAQGDQNFFINTTKSEFSHYSVRFSGGTQSDDLYNLTSMDLIRRWVKKDVPALKEESYVTTMFNYISRVEFQLNYIQYSPTSERHDYMGNWFIASEKLLKSPYFGGALDDDNRWMADELKGLTTGVTGNEQKIQKIFQFIRNNFNCTSHDGIYADRSLKTVYKERNGNVAEINLLLTAMLRHEKIEADPVVLSTRDNGYASETYPTMARFNYVVCIAHDNGKTYYLDASLPLIGFNRLPVDCYNGMARTINKEKPYVLNFSADSLKEQKTSMVMIFNDEKDVLTGTFASTLGSHESYNLRKQIKKTSEKEYFKDLQTDLGTGIQIQNPGIDSLTQLEMPAKISFDLGFKSFGQEDIIYFNPMMLDQLKENPFKAAERHYPVEMPYCIDEIYTLNMEIPKGYVVDEIPKPTRVNYNGTEGLFEYLIEKSNDNIQMRTHLKLTKANWSPDDYATLRQFFGEVVKKESEQVVFKKNSK